MSAGILFWGVMGVNEVVYTGIAPCQLQSMVAWSLGLLFTTTSLSLRCAMHDSICISLQSGSRLHRSRDMPACLLIIIELGGIDEMMFHQHENC